MNEAMLLNKRAHVCHRPIKPVNTPMNVGDAQQRMGAKQSPVMNPNFAANQAVALEILRVTKTDYGLGEAS